jgi:hypothetical protein
LDKTKLESLNGVLAHVARRDAFGNSDAPSGPQDRSAQFREPPHVLFNIALLYSVSRIDTGRSFSGVTP